MPEDTVFPIPEFASARKDARGRQMPQAIAHRGYRAKYPENTLLAFKGAIDAGAHAVETDLHISKDGVVVISHDGNLKRCFGQEKKIIDCTWDELKEFRTVAEPHEPMPRLKDVLDFLSQPGMEEIWLLLDIKLDNDAEVLMRLIGETLSASSHDWTTRVVLGIWAAKYLPLARKYVSGYPVMHIGFSTSYARHFFKIPNVGFNMLLPILVAPGGRSFMRDAREKHHRKLIAWTVNEADRMEWCIRRKLDGVISDDPKKFLEICEKFDDGKKEGVLPVWLFGYLDILRVWIWITTLAWWFGKKFLPVASREMIEKKPVD